MSLFHKTPDEPEAPKSSGPVIFSEKESAVALLFLMVTADGSIAPEEEELVIAASNRMNLLRKQSIDEFNDTVDKVREVIEDYGRDEAFTGAVTNLPADLRETLYTLAADVAFAEGTACPEEVEYLRKMQEGFGMSDELATKIIEVIRIKNRG